MERNHYHQCNPQCYEEHLSVFGKKVLQVLIKQWNKKCERNNMDGHHLHQQIPSAYNKRVLTFNDSNLREIPTIRDGKKTENECNNDKSLDINLMVGNLPNGAKSTELGKTLDYTNNENFNATRDDLIRSVIEDTEHCNIVYDLYNKSSDDDDNHVISIPNKDNEDITKNSCVNWSNMFDTELFSEVPATRVKLNECQNIIPNQNTFNIQFPNENNKNSPPVRLNEHDTITNQIKDKKKILKRKNQIKITNTVPKKLKKLVPEVDSIPKISLRKVKYTKTVKNWLNYMDLHSDNAAEEYVNDTKEKVEKCAENAKKMKITNERVADGSMKKVVQAQLANKDGIMKFAKPNNKIGNGSEDSVKHDKEPEDKSSIRKKKIKAKFVAPIKSQIPVKNVTYEMHAVNMTNIEEYSKILSGFQNTNIAIVLVYSNGFSQLNSHHTDDTCVPEGIIINIDEVFYYFKGPEKQFKDILRQTLECNKILCYEGKQILIYMASQFDLDVNGLYNIIDTKIGGCLLNPDSPPENFTELQKLLSHTLQFTITTECVLQKTAWYITLMKECESILNAFLVENLLWTVFVEIEMRLVPIIADMELRGVRVDLDKLKSMEDILLTKMKVVEELCHKAAGKVFQINSTVQVRTILYDELMLDTKCNVKIRETISKGAKSTSENMLRSFVSVHALPKLILEYRHLHKAHATFLTGIAQHIKNGIVRSIWVQTAAATGRIACNNPNLQAIPKTPFSLVMFPEQGDTACQLLRFRSVYISRVGHTLLAADFKHVECRVFAHAAGDTGLLDALKSRDDLFKVLAAKWLDKLESDITYEDRERTKRIVYASLYGAGSRKLMDILDVNYEQALGIIASFNRTFPSLKSFGRCVVSRCEQSGGRLFTLWGRARIFKHISSNDFALRSHAERQAVNFVVQGSAADLCKMAMIRTCERLRASAPPVRARLVLQIHDELVWEVADEDLARAAAIIKEVMENCGHECGMAMTLPVAISTGRSWGDMAEYTELFNV